MKRKVEQLSLLELPKQLPLFSAVKKQLRSKLPQRRRRFQISPIFNSFFTNINCSSHLTNEEFSFECDSSRISANKRGFDEEGIKEFRRNGRPNYSDKRTNEWLEDTEVEVSEYSCVESCSGAVSVDRDANVRRGDETVEKFTGKFVDKKLKGSEISLQFDQSEANLNGTKASETVNQSEITKEVAGKYLKIGAAKANQFYCPLEFNSNDVVSSNSVLSNLQKASEAESAQQVESGDDEAEKSGAERRVKLVPIDVDFTCSEHFSNDIVSDVYSSAYSELQSDILLDSSDFDTDYTPSVWYDSGSQFSEKSNESPSPTFQLFLKFSQEFCRSNKNSESNAKSCDSSSEDGDSSEITVSSLYLKFLEFTSILRENWLSLKDCNLLLRINCGFPFCFKINLDTIMFFNSISRQL